MESAKNYRNSIIALLRSEKLPVDDLPADLDNFVISITSDDELRGVAGLEVYGNYGLLRSLVVAPLFRGQGVANDLLTRIESFAKAKNLKEIYLLTETAPAYFERKGFIKATREDVPDAVKQSSEFSHVCPVSAIVMKKRMMKNILVLCTGNSCRSQMAHGYLEHFGGGKANIYSAGITTHGVNPKAIQVMAEDGIDISNHTSNNVDEYISVDFDYVITVCDNANEACPFFPGKMERFHQNFPDPPKFKGTPDEIMDEFRRVRDMVKTYCGDFIKMHIEKLS